MSHKINVFFFFFSFLLFLLIRHLSIVRLQLLRFGTQPTWKMSSVHLPVTISNNATSYEPPLQYIYCHVLFGFVFIVKSTHIHTQHIHLHEDYVKSVFEHRKFAWFPKIYHHILRLKLTWVSRKVDRIKFTSNLHATF